MPNDNCIHCAHVDVCEFEHDLFQIFEKIINHTDGRMEKYELLFSLIAENCKYFEHKPS